MLKKCVKVVALAFAVGGGFPDSADAARPREIVCEGEYSIYDLLGRDVTLLNGSLYGVYVVKTTDAAQKVIVK